jgi:hypothetical protein
MTVLIVGADKIETFIPRLKALGAEEILHWNARNCRASKNKIPARTEMVIFCTDFLNHNAAQTIKRQVKERKLPVVYCRRAWSQMAVEVESTLERCKNEDRCPQANNCRRRQSVH